MSDLLVIDPSIRCCGVAIFRDGDLVDTTAVREPHGRTKLPAIQRCLDMAHRVTCWCLGKCRPDEIASEWPKIYAPGKGKGDPTKTIPGLSGVAVGVAVDVAAEPALARLHGGDLKCYSYLPDEWVQGTKKNTKGDPFDSARARRIAKRLRPEELEVWGRIKTHDEIDAVGIGLHHLGRFKPRRF